MDSLDIDCKPVEALADIRRMPRAFSRNRQSNVETSKKVQVMASRVAGRGHLPDLSAPFF
jgi:hypothetical protein